MDEGIRFPARSSRSRQQERERGGGGEGRGGTEFVEENDAAERRRNASSTCLTVITRARVHLLSAA